MEQNEEDVANLSASTESTAIPAISQHVVPQVYLKRFADRHTHKILLMRRPGAGGLFVPPRLVTVRTATAHNDFYTFLTSEGQRDERIEKQLSVFEGQYQVLYKALRSPSTLTEASRSIIRFLAALQYARGQSQRDILIRWHALEALGGRTAFLKANRNCSIDDIEAHLARAADGKSVRAHANEFAKKATGLALAAVADVIYMMNLCVITSNAQDFFTSDQPVVFFNPTAKPNTYGKYPNFRLSLEITYPLTRRRCAFFSWMPIPLEAPAPAEIVTAINSRTAYTSVRDVFYTPSLTATFLDRFPSDMTDKIERKKPLLWTYMAKEYGGITLRAAIRRCNLDEADVLSSYKIPFWWFHGFRNMPPEFKAAIVAAEERQRSLDGW